MTPLFFDDYKGTVVTAILRLGLGMFHYEHCQFHGNAEMSIYART